MTISNNCSRTKAFTLLEVLVTVSVIAVTAGLIVGATHRSTQGVKVKKLEQDVAALNSAIKIYKANGGKIVGSWKTSKILEELKTKADATTGEQLAGLGGSMIDHRLVEITETYAEAASGNPKALWDAVNQRFYISTSNIRGIKEFKLDETRADEPAEERVREISLALNTDPGWIWDHVDQAGDARPDPITPDQGWDIGGGSGANGGGGGIEQLSPPVYDIPGGTYTLNDYDLLLGLSQDGNEPGAGNIVWSTDGSNWSPYASSLTVTPGTTIYAYVASTDPTRWQDSELASQTYDYNAVQLGIAVSFEKSSYTYAEMGGALMAGNYSITLATPGEITLTNSEQIPASYQNSDNFRPYWTYDGSSPTDSNTAIAGADFSGGFPGDDVPLGLSSYGPSDATVKVGVRSTIEGYLLDSEVVTENLGIAVTNLRNPIINLLGPVNNPAAVIGMDFVTDFGDMPEGAEIYYTTDGSTPTRSDDLYTGSFPATFITVIKARVFPPVPYDAWFNPSGIATVNIDPSQWLISGSAAGEFSNPYGHSNMVSSIGPGQSNSYWQWGTAAYSDSVANYANFDGDSFNDVAVGDYFLLGEYSYQNGTVWSSTDADGADFDVTIDFFNGTYQHTFTFDIEVHTTSNNWQNPYDDADWMYLSDIASTSTVDFFGTDYTLELAFGAVDQYGFSTIDQFFTFEGESASGELWGKIIAQ